MPLNQPCAEKTVTTLPYRENKKSSEKKQNVSPFFPPLNINRAYSPYNANGNPDRPVISARFV